MGFINKILRRLKRPNYDEHIRELESRLSELQKLRKAADDEIERLKNLPVETPGFDIAVSSPRKEYKTFIPPTPMEIRSMKDLMEKRIKEEEERKRQLRQQVSRVFDDIKNLIEDKKPDEAQELLYKTSSAIAELKDEHLTGLYQELKHDIEGVREELRQIELRRLAEEAKRREEEEARRLERERIRKQREEEERLERERKAREYEERLAKEEESRHQEIERLTTLVTRKKDESDAILEYLNMKGVRRFYHFTDKKNLNQIKKLGGLYSWYYCKQNGIEIPNAGGNRDSRNFDIRHGLQDYVRLSFCKDHPMAYRKHNEGSELYLLYIDIEVATFIETLFTDRNAASSSFACGAELKDLHKVNIDATQRTCVSRDDGEVFSLHQAECMIKTFIPKKYITNIDSPQVMSFNSKKRKYFL